MNGNDQEKHFGGKVKNLLDEGVENLNSQTRERLEYVQIKALDLLGKSVVVADPEFFRIKGDSGNILQKKQIGKNGREPKKG